MSERIVKINLQSPYLVLRDEMTVEHAASLIMAHAPDPDEAEAVIKSLGMHFWDAGSHEGTDWSISFSALRPAEH